MQKKFAFTCAGVQGSSIEALNTAVEEDSPGANKLEVLEAFHRAAEEIYDMADQLPTPDKIETRLKSLNQYVETTFERNLPEDVRVAMRSQVATKLRPFRERVNSEELARMDGELTKQLIIKHFRAERLSLFGIGGRTARLAERTRGNHDVAQEAAEVSVTRAEIPPEIIAVEDFIMKFYAAYPAHRRGTLEEVRAVVWDLCDERWFCGRRQRQGNQWHHNAPDSDASIS